MSRLLIPLALTLLAACTADTPPDPTCRREGSVEWAACPEGWASVCGEDAYLERTSDGSVVYRDSCGWAHCERGELVCLDVCPEGDPGTKPRCEPQPD